MQSQVLTLLLAAANAAMADNQSSSSAVAETVTEIATVPSTAPFVDLSTVSEQLPEAVRPQPVVCPGFHHRKFKAAHPILKVEGTDIPSGGENPASVTVKVDKRDEASSATVEPITTFAVGGPPPMRLASAEGDSTSTIAEPLTTIAVGGPPPYRLDDYSTSYPTTVVGPITTFAVGGPPPLRLVTSTVLLGPGVFSRTTYATEWLGEPLEKRFFLGWFSHLKTKWFPGCATTAPPTYTTCSTLQTSWSQSVNTTSSN